MKAIKIVEQQWGAVASHKIVEIEATQEEINELRAARKIIDAWEREVFNKTKFKKINSDWYRISFNTKNNKVVARLEAGSCG